MRALVPPNGDFLWPAASLAVMSVSTALLAVQRRSEGLAFLTGVGVNLAASLVVGHFNRAYIFPLNIADDRLNAARDRIFWFSDENLHLSQSCSLCSSVAAMPGDDPILPLPSLLRRHRDRFN